MFNLVRKPKPGECPARRCTAPTSEVEGNIYGLCAKHLQIWIDAGRPAFESAELASVQAPGAAPELHAEIVQPIETAALKLRDQITSVSLVIQDDTQMQAIGALAQHAQTKINEIEATRKRATKPLNATLREINGWFRPAREAYESVKAACQQAMLAYERTRESEKAQALASGDHATAMATEPVALPAGTHARTRWAFRVVDFAQVPREFLAVNAARVQTVVDAQREKTAIPGIEVYEDVTLVTKGTSA